MQWRENNFSLEYIYFRIFLCARTRSKYLQLALLCFAYQIWPQVSHTIIRVYCDKHKHSHMHTQTNTHTNTQMRKTVIASIWLVIISLWDRSHARTCTLCLYVIWSVWFNWKDTIYFWDPIKHFQTKYLKSNVDLLLFWFELAVSLIFVINKAHVFASDISTHLKYTIVLKVYHSMVSAFHWFFWTCYKTSKYVYLRRLSNGDTIEESLADEEASVRFLLSIFVFWSEIQKKIYK
jgi:hypothetical protein